MATAVGSALAPRPALADHNSIYAVCPDPVPEGDAARMGIRRPGHKVIKAFAFTVHHNHTADSSDYTVYHADKFEQSEGSTLWFPVRTTADDIPEHDETFEIGFWDGGVWHSCVVTIVDDDEPEIVNVEITTSPSDRSAYRAGENIDVAVTFDSEVDVDVDGSPLLALFFGHDGQSAWRGAGYLQGTGTRELIFRYHVQPEDFDADGLTVGSAASRGDGSPAYGFSGAVYAEGTDVDVEYAHQGVEADGRQRVDGRPYVESNRIVSAPQAGRQTYRANEIIEVAYTFNTRVVVAGDVCTTLYVGYDGHRPEGTQRHARYLRGSGTDTLVFGYTVRTGDSDPKGVMVALGTDTTGFCGSGTITAEGTVVQRNPWYLGKGPDPNHRIDTVPPDADTVSILSQPADGQAYRAAETISIEVAFSEEVFVEGTPHLRLEMGADTREARLSRARSSADRLIFEYEVRSGDIDTDGIGIGANSLHTADGRITDRAGSNASLDHPAIAADSTHRVSG